MSVSNSETKNLIKSRQLDACAIHITVPYFKSIHDFSHTDKDLFGERGTGENA